MHSDSSVAKDDEKEETVSIKADSKDDAKTKSVTDSNESKKERTVEDVLNEMTDEQ